MKFIKDKRGQWAHPGKPTMIPDVDGHITMEGVNYPVLGIDDLGNEQVMMPGANYKFPGNSVYEVPLINKELPNKPHSKPGIQEWNMLYDAMNKSDLNIDSVSYNDYIGLPDNLKLDLLAPLLSNIAPGPELDPNETSAGGRRLLKTLMALVKKIPYVAPRLLKVVPVLGNMLCSLEAGKGSDLPPFHHIKNEDPQAYYNLTNPPKKGFEGPGYKKGGELPKYRHHGEIGRWFSKLWKPQPIKSITFPPGSTSPLRLSPNYQSLYSRTLPSTLRMPNSELYRGVDNPKLLGLSNFNEFRNLSFPEWQNHIKNYNNPKIPNESSGGITLSSLDNPLWVSQQDKNGKMTAGQLQSIINSIKKPVDNAILQQTFNEFIVASRTIPEGTMHPTTGKVEIPPPLGPGEFVEGKPKIDIDIFKAAVKDKVAKFSYSSTKDHANMGLAPLGYSDKRSGGNVIENSTILLHSDDHLGRTVATGDETSVTSKTHFKSNPNVWGHIRYFRSKDNPQRFNILESQSDEAQQYHKIGQSITQLTNDNVIWTRLLNGEKERVAQDFFNTMWSTGSTPDGPLRLIGIEGGITPNSKFPIETNIPENNSWENVKGAFGDYSSFPSAKQYKEEMNHNHWEPTKFPRDVAYEGERSITFNNYDEVLQFRQRFIDQHLAKWGNEDYTPVSATREVIEDHIKDNKVRINDLTSSITTDPSKVDEAQLIRNLQKKQYQKNQQQRIFDESIIYAIKNGYRELAYPTQKTAATIQSFSASNAPHMELDQPWTMVNELDFFRKMYALTSEKGFGATNQVAVQTGGNPYDVIRRYGDFIFVPDNYQNLPKHNKNKVIHHRYETGGYGMNGFMNRYVDMNIPTRKELGQEPHMSLNPNEPDPGLYKINNDGSWTFIPNYNVKPDNKLSGANFDPTANRPYSANFSTMVTEEITGWRTGNNLYENVLNIRNEKHIPLTDGSFTPKVFSKNQQRILEYYDIPNVEKMIFKAFGQNYPYRVEADKKGNEWIIIQFPQNWQPDAKLGKQKLGGEVLPKYQDGNEVKVNYHDVEKGIRHIESLDGVLMKNKTSTASGLYGQLFEEIEEMSLYDGTRDEFIADIKYQKELFDKRYNGEIEGIPGLERNGIELYNEYKDQIDNFTLTPTEIAAISNMLGRQGTRNYLGNVLRDGKTLEEGVPSAYGPGKPPNKTPEEFFKLFNASLQKKKVGGEIRDEVIADMLENGAFLPKFKKGAEMSLEGVIGKYIIKKQYDEAHRLPYIQLNSNDGEIRDNRIYYDKDDIKGNDEFNIIDIDAQMIEQDREHARVKAMIKKYEDGHTLSPTEELYLGNLGLLDDQQKSTESTIPTENPPKMKGEEIKLEDINVRKDLYNKTDNNNKGISLEKQIEFYDAHVNNLYSQYKLAPKVRKIYDRLNSLYYTDAKASNMTVLDYIKSLNN